MKGVTGTEWEIGTGIIAVLLMIGITLLIHPFWSQPEGFSTGGKVGAQSPARQGTSNGGVGGSEDETVFEYVADDGGDGDATPWSPEVFQEWSQKIRAISTQFQRVQKKIQSSLKIYEATEGSLEQGARKKREHWTTMTPEQRSQAKMVNDPVKEYYAPLQGASQPLLGGLPDNEGKLPFGIPQIAFPSLREELQYPGVGGWGANAPAERTPAQKRAELVFYQHAKEYLQSLPRPVDDLGTNVSLLSWSVRDNQKLSLLPRVEALQRQIEESRKTTRNKKGDTFKGVKSGSEGFEDTSGKMCKKTVEIPVYSWKSANQSLITLVEKLSGMESRANSIADDVSKAKQILDSIQKNADAQRAKARGAVGK